MVEGLTSVPASKAMKGLTHSLPEKPSQHATCNPPFGPTRETGVFAQFPPPESRLETETGGGSAGAGEGGGDGTFPGQKPTSPLKTPALALHEAQYAPKPAMSGV